MIPGGLLRERIAPVALLGLVGDPDSESMAQTGGLAVVGGLEVEDRRPTCESPALKTRKA